MTTAQVAGPVEVINTIKPKNNQAFPVVEDIDVLGGFCVVGTTAERDALPNVTVGKHVHVNDVDATYKAASLEPTVWVEAGGGGGAVSSVNGFTGAVDLVAGDVGAESLGSVAQHMTTEHGDQSLDVAGGSGDYEVDFAGPVMANVVIAGPSTLSGVNYYKGGRVDVLLRNDGVVNGATVDVPAGWLLSPNRPIVLNANDSGLLRLRSFGTTEGQVHAWWQRRDFFDRLDVYDAGFDIDWLSSNGKTVVSGADVTIGSVNQELAKNSLIKIFFLNDGASPITITLPAGWVFYSSMPRVLEAGQKATLIIWAGGVLESDVVAFWDLEGGVHASAHQHLGSDEIATETAAAFAIPKATTDGYLDSAWIPDWLAILTGCGDGSDGPLTVSTPISLARNAQYSIVTLVAGGKITNIGYDFRAQVVDATNADAGALSASFWTNGTSSSGSSITGGSSGSLTVHYGRPPVGTSTRCAGGASGIGTGVGVAGTNVTTAMVHGGQGGVGGVGGAGSGGAGGAAGTVSTKTVVFSDYEGARLDGMADGNPSTTGAPLLSTNYGLIGAGGPGSSGGTGGGDGTSISRGAGCPGNGVMAGRWRIGRLILGANAPLFDARGCKGGAGASATAGNLGGGGAGGGGGGGLAVVVLGEAVGTLAGAISASAGSGGDGGAGFGTGLGGLAGRGGNGGHIYLRRVDTRITTILDNSAVAASAPTAPSGTVGGIGSAGATCTVNL